MSIAEDGAFELPSLPRFILGLDLGKQGDYSALVAIEDCEGECHVRGIRRWPLSTRYQQVADDVARLLAGRDLRHARRTLVVDRTGVGDAVVEMLSAVGLRFESVVITGGLATARAGSVHHVPKRELVAAIQVVLQNRRLKIAPTLALAELLTGELTTFQVHTTETGRQTFEAREGEHDDLVLACALAVWYATRASARAAVAQMNPFL